MAAPSPQQIRYDDAFMRLLEEGLPALKHKWVAEALHSSIIFPLRSRQGLLQHARALLADIPQDEGVKLELFQIGGYKYPEAYFNINIPSGRDVSVSLPKDISNIVETLSWSTPDFRVAISLDGDDVPQVFIRYRTSERSYTLRRRFAWTEATCSNLMDALNGAIESLQTDPPMMRTIGLVEFKFTA